MTVMNGGFDKESFSDLKLTKLLPDNKLDIGYQPAWNGVFNKNCCCVIAMKGHKIYFVTGKADGRHEYSPVDSDYFDKAIDKWIKARTFSYAKFDEKNPVPIKDKDLRYSSFTGCEFNGVDFSGCNLCHAYIQQCGFNQCNLSDTKFHGSHLLRGRVLECQVDNANLAGCSIDGTMFYSCRGKAAGLDSISWLDGGATTKEYNQYKHNAVNVLSGQAVKRNLQINRSQPQVKDRGR